MHFSKKVKVFLAVIPLTMALLSQQAFAASYSVTKGDSLYQISKLFGTSVSTVKETNKLTSDLIQPGQKLDVPSVTYTVKTGDSLFLIANSNKLAVSSLRKANNKWDDKIYSGQQLILPGITTGGSQQTVDATPAKSIKNPVIPYSLNDLDLLSRLITAEADGEPYNAKVAVADVVINRVKDSRFPDTIKDVIYEVSSGFYQFTPVENGCINKPASQDAKKAAYDALSGNDLTHGAVYYFDDSTKNKWLWSKPVALRVDKMVYTY
jgi:N-acetylmuramoyl-L-alanine amidase